MKKPLKCYIYTRVSTSMQVDGYSLDAQWDKLHKYADYQDMIIAGEYSEMKENPAKVLREDRNLCRCFLILSRGRTTWIMFSFSNFPDLEEMQRTY